MVQVPEQFVTETLWPEFEKIDAELNAYLQEITDRVVKQVLHEDSSEAVVVEQPLQMDLGPNSASTESITGEHEKPNRQSDIQKTGRHKKKKRKKKRRKR